jgi:DNA gyrase/topoisomerase IV subunit B
MWQVDGVAVEVALQWCSDTFSDLLVGFVNSVKTVDGGTHIDGFKVWHHLHTAEPSPLVRKGRH